MVVLGSDYKVITYFQLMPLLICLIFLVCRILKQNTLDEGDGVNINGYSDGAQGHAYTRSFSPSHLQLPTDYISNRLNRESSLEAVHPVG